MKRTPVSLIYLILILSGCSTNLFPTTPTVYQPLISSTVAPAITPILAQPISTPTLFLSLTPTPIIISRPTVATGPTKRPESPDSSWPSLLNGEYVFYATSGAILQIQYILDSSVGSFLSVDDVEMHNGMNITSDGKLFTFVRNVPTGYTKIKIPRVMIFDFVEKKSIEVNESEGCTYPTFAPDGKFLAMVCPENYTDYSLDETNYIVVVDLRAGISKRVLSMKGGRITFLTWSPDGKNIAFVNYLGSGPQKESFDHLYLLDTSCFSDPRTCQSKNRYLVSANHTFYWLPIKWSPDNMNILALDGYDELRIISATNGTSKDIPVTGDGDSFSGYAWSSDASSIWYTKFWSNNKQNRKKVFVASVRDEWGKTVTMEVNNQLGENAALFENFKILNFIIGQTYIVTDIVNHIVLQDKPGSTRTVSMNLKRYDEIIVIDGPVNLDYCDWWKVKIGDNEGWIQGAKYWLEPRN